MLLQGAAAWGMFGAGSFTILSKACAALLDTGRCSAGEGDTVANLLTPPAHGSIPVAFMISDGAVMIDFTGPWEVFQDVSISTRSEAQFRLYTVVEAQKPIRASGGMKILPDYTILNAPAPKVLVIPAQSKASENAKGWIRSSAKTADVVMSSCNSSFVLPTTGLFSSKATNSHSSPASDSDRMLPEVLTKPPLRFIGD